ncbi:AsmA family protein [Sphingomonas sp. ac-8]|uniref:AsmA family protein n=1 Tax=Sphingomonas sp. ac-8 TaxID=3242977 RepID=UPI003A80F88E
MRNRRRSARFCCPMTRAVPRRLAIGATALTAGSVLLVGALPVQFARDLVADRLSADLGRPVTIGSLGRAEVFSFTPTILVRDIRIPQAAWAGSGTLASVREARVRLPVLPLLVGRVSPRSIVLDGGRITLVRAADGRESWSNGAGGNDSGGGGLRLEQLEVRDTQVTYRDAKQDRSITLRVEARPNSGVIARGKGRIHGAEVDASLCGAAIVPGKPWAFAALLDGPALRFEAKGSMAHAFDTSDMRAHVETRAADLRLVDAIIEAGLFGSQPVRLSADVRHVDDRWEVPKIGGTIGRSRFTGKVTVSDDGDRKRLDGEVTAARLDFDDLSSDAGQAEAAAKRKRIGSRLIPDSRIDLSKMQQLDGELRFRVERLLWKSPTPFRSASGTLTLDHGRLTLSPVEVALVRGRMGGRLVVDQRDGARVPTFTADLRVDRSTLKSFVPDAPMDGALTARAELRGPGITVRQAIARSDGQVGMVARDGAIPARLASFLGLDVGRGALADEASQATLRCVVMRLDVHNGLGRANPIVIDTSRSRSDVTGTVRFGPETLAMQVAGAPKHKSLLRLETPVRVAGTIKSPEIDIPPRVKTVGNVFKMLGRAIGGKQAPLAQDADCNILAKRALAVGSTR